MAPLVERLRRAESTKRVNLARFPHGSPSRDLLTEEADLLAESIAALIRVAVERDEAIRDAEEWASKFWQAERERDEARAERDREHEFARKLMFEDETVWIGELNKALNEQNTSLTERLMASEVECDRLRTLLEKVA